MKFTKKQIIVGVVVSLLIAGGAGGVVANHNAQVAHAKQVEKQKQAEEKVKAAYKKLQETAQTAVIKAETFKAEADIKTANTAVSKLKKADQSKLSERIQKVSANWKAVHATDKLVVAAEKAHNDKNVAAAQKSIDKLSAPMVKAQKALLQKRLNVVKKAISDSKAKAKAAAEAKAAQEALKQAEAAQKAETVETPAQNNEAVAISTPAYIGDTAVSTPNNDNNTSAPATDNDSGNSGNNGGSTPPPSQPVTPPAGGGNTGGGATTPPPATTYTGWVKNMSKGGIIVWSQGGFPTLQAAYAAAAAWANSQNSMDIFSAGSY
jgi:colicin import membrane protein